MTLIWMPHAAHFWGGRECQFHLAAVIVEKRIIVSSIGEFARSRVYGPEGLARPRNESDPFELLSLRPGHFYETIVFMAKKQNRRCCPYQIRVKDQVDKLEYKTPEAATAGHMAMIKKWSRKRCV